MRKGTKNTKCEKMIKVVNEKCFIQPAIEKERIRHHEGYTHELLGIPKDFNLSHAETLLEKVVKTPIGKTFKNPLKIGKSEYVVTRELKRHANFALNLIRITEKRSKRK